MNRIRLTAALASVALGASLAACGGDPTSSDKSEGDTIKVGSADFPESEILGEIYAQALEAKDIKVERQFKIGSRERYLPALQNGEIDLFPEYTGALLVALDDKATATTPEDVEEALDDALPEGLDILDPAPAEDKDSLNVTAETASKYNLKTIADLKQLPKIRLGAPSEFETRRDGVPGLERVYQLSGIQFRPNESKLIVEELLDGKTDVANIFSTTPAISENKFVTLEDPENLFGAQNVVPVINEKKATDKVEDTLDAVSAKLTTEDLLALNTENVGPKKTSAADLAKKWLTDKGLI